MSSRSEGPRGAQECWISTSRPSRRSLGDLLRVRTYLNAIKNKPHGEERPKGASRTTYNIHAAFLVRDCIELPSSVTPIVQCKLKVDNQGAAIDRGQI